MSSDSLDLDEDELFQMALKEQSQRDVNYQQPSSKPSRPVSNFVQPPPQHAANQGVSTAPRNNNTRAPPMQRPQQRRGSMDDDDDSEVEMLSSSSWDEDSSKDRGSESRIGPEILEYRAVELVQQKSHDRLTFCNSDDAPAELR